MPAIRVIFLSERDRWSLWLPVFLGAGIALYFLLPFEPPAWTGPAVLGVALLGGWIGRRGGPLLGVALCLASAALGFSTIQYESARAAAPVLERETGPATLTGRVAEVEERPDGRRVTLERLSIEHVAPEATPARVRIKLHGERPAPGITLTVPAILMPPPPPAAPGAFNFSRVAWFERLGGVGFAIGAWQAAPTLEPPGLFDGVVYHLAGLRDSVTRRILAAEPGQAGGVAAALIAGERGAIPESLLQDYRDSGLAHLLSISGLHMSLVAGFVFVAVRRLLALSPWLALRVDIKKLTAAAALGAIAVYLVISGGSVPTQRAFFMTGVVLTAVLLDRTAISMRLVAWAAVAVLLWSPDALMGASFQMSFAAVTALIAAYEALKRPIARWRAEASPPWWSAPLLYFAGIALTTLIASGATGAFALYHFNRFAFYSLLANLAAVPLMGLWVMPSGVAALVLMPFGLDGVPLWLMTAGIGMVNQVAGWVAGIEGAVLHVSAMPGWGLALVALGGLWLCLWRRVWRLLGVPVLALGLMSAPLTPPPDVLVSGDGRLMGVRGADGRLLVNSLRRDSFARGLWADRQGGALDPGAWPDYGAAGGGALRCDALGCVLERSGLRVALLRDRAAAVEDCRRVAVVIAAVPLRIDCPAATIDRFTLWRHGAHALWIGADGGLRTETVAETMGERPWTPRRFTERRWGDD